MGKVKSFYHNELLLERESDILHLQNENRRLHTKIAELRLALLKIQSSDFDNLHKDLLKKALQDG